MQRSPVLFRRKRRMLRIRGLLSAVVCGNCRPQPGYVGPTGLVWCFAGVVSLPGSQNRTQGRTGPSLVFSPQNELTPPPKGGGAGYHLSWVGRVCPARSKLGHAGPTGPVWGFAGVVPLPGSQNRTQGRTGASLVLARWLALVRRIVLPFGNPV